VIAVNDCYRACDFADYLYARDFSWWGATAEGCSHPNYFLSRQVIPSAEFWTGSEKASREYGLRYIKARTALGLSPIPGIIHDGGAAGANSGYQAINLAIHFGARRILLLGFDMGATGAGHWFGAHPKPLVNVEAHEYRLFAVTFNSMVKPLDEMGVEVVNCSRASNIACFRVSTIERELGLSFDLCRDRSSTAGVAGLSLEVSR
jgi:hypothetical protein